MACCQVTHLNSGTRWKCSWTLWTTDNKRNKNDIITLLFMENHRRHLKSLTLCMLSNSSKGQPSRKSEKLKASKPIMNIANLRQELQDFISEVGLPSDSVPSYKELSRHGRLIKDLANAVRRRGYKAIAQLLTEPDGIHITKSEGKKRTHIDDTVSLEGELKDPDSSSVVQVSDVPPHDYGGSSDGPGYFHEQNSNLHIQYSPNIWSSGECPDSIQGTDTVHMAESNSSYTLKSSSYKSLRERAAYFVRTGYFHYIEGEDDSEEYQGDEEINENGCREYRRDDATSVTPYVMDADKSPDWPSESDSSVPSISGRMVVTKAAYQSYFWSDYPLTSDPVTAKKTAFWTSETQPLSREEALNPLSRNSSDQFHFNDDGIHESEIMKYRLAETQRFNSLLHSKESELSELKHELEKEKAKLYSIQAKAIAEVSHEKQILSEKETELSAADQALSNLKQVRIEYWGEGINVKVTGSFNGWQHHISMEPDLASEIQISNGTRGPLMWSTELWLYPGIYEQIKFIVDGNWQLDSRREIVRRNEFENNVLKVEH
ncbi:protein PTST homolog 3, chloroplastic isoform X1 [Cryptomeria japonica]|uniref:protein PTST homolog 3, chloroplastic isoform X1 n=1 Tax=Cryptomeria japonica TaxID=3369 RepID=UPI0027DAABB3|nr:protein PTST homolog 3, chloroplastic isoform X1 [Cryptomeria japonica]